MKTYVRATVLLVLCFIICLKLAGCGSDSCGPQVCQCGVTLDNVWPNDEGRGWSYKYTMRTWDDACTLYTDVEDVPPAPSLDYIENLIGEHPIGENVTTSVGSYRMRFSGDSTTMSGATAQALRDTAYFPEPLLLLDGHSNPAGDRNSAGGMSATGAFIEAYTYYRASVLGESPVAAPGLLPAVYLTPTPILVHGGAWEKTDDYIGTYGDIDTEIAWKYLEADLRTGSEFDYQAPSTGVRIKCRILGKTAIETEMGSFENGLDCLYLIDIGVMTIEGSLDPIGYQRHITYGRVIYVPDVGPVYSYERFFVCVGDTLSSGAGDMELSLMSTGLN